MSTCVWTALSIELLRRRLNISIVERVLVVRRTIAAAQSAAGYSERAGLAGAAARVRQQAAVVGDEGRDEARVGVGAAAGVVGGRGQLGRGQQVLVI